MRSRFEISASRISDGRGAVAVVDDDDVVVVVVDVELVSVDPG
jgi:hypothetical protein